MNHVEQLILEGRRVKIKTAERAARADAGVVVDYLRCTVKRDSLSRLDFIPEDASDAVTTGLLARRLAELAGFEFGEMRERGRDYYAHTATIWNEHGKEVGSVSGGGAQQRGTFCFTLKGEACTYGREGWERAAFELFSVLEAKVTRVDLCRDFYDGEKGGVDAARDGYRSGLFDYRNRRPSCEVAGDWEHNQGRTWYVGKRESGKLFRAYEKGHQFGDMGSAWWRAEVELRGHQRIIPLEVLLRPAAFFAGAYPFCAELLDGVPPVTVPTGHMTAEASVERCLRWIERTVAPALVHISLQAGFDWIAAIAEEHAYRPVPGSLKGLSSAAITTGVERALVRLKTSLPFTKEKAPSAAVPASLAPSMSPA